MKGQKVPWEKFGAPDLLVAGLLMGYFALIVLEQAGVKSKPVTNHEIIAGESVFIVLTVGLAAFMQVRGISVIPQTGIGKLRLDKVIGIAALLLISVFPMMNGVSYATELVLQKVFHSDFNEMEMVKHFVEASEKSNYRTLVLTLVAGGIIAPITEEFLFRGYFYPVLKRYAGIVPAVILNSGLFAAIHLNAAATPALFLLAVCLTLAYEWTGSILTNMCMHSLFNLTSFCALYYTSHHSLPS